MHQVLWEFASSPHESEQCRSVFRSQADLYCSNSFCKGLEVHGSIPVGDEKAVTLRDSALDSETGDTVFNGDGDPRELSCEGDENIGSVSPASL